MDTTTKFTKPKYLLLIAAFVIHIIYYYSAHITGSLDIFFEHVTKGQDFFQIPNAAYSFLRDGGLQGDLPGGQPKYTDCCAVNPNVYHPLFALIIGIPLQLFKPWTAFNIWIIIHAVITVVTLIFLWSKYKSHPKVLYAFSVFLLFSYHYYEIQHAQYHFLLNYFLLLFLYDTQKENESRAGIWLFITLLIKPIGLFWIIPLLIYKKYKTVLSALSLYAASLIPAFFPEGEYYINNLLGASRLSGASYNLASISKLITVDLDYFKYISFALAGILIIYQLAKKPPIYKVISLWIIWMLLFYGGVYHYYYTTMATLIMFGILLNEIKITSLSKIIIIGLVLQPPIVFFKLAGSPAILSEKDYAIAAIWSSLFLILYVIYVLDLKSLSKINFKSDTKT